MPDGPAPRPATPASSSAAAPPGSSLTPGSGGASGWVLFALILVAGVANLNLAVANVALPDIGKAFDASQTQLNLVAVGFSLGLAASVLYLGAVGDRYGRKLLLVLGMALTVPACLVAGFAPSVEVLIGARLVGGLAAGMAYPTTLALITALWSGPARTRAIAMWSAVGGAVAALGSLLSGALLERFPWNAVFLVSAPLALVGLVLAVVLVPAHVNETTDPVDNLGGILSVVLIASLVLAINFAAVPNAGTLAAGLGVLALVSGIGFVLRQRRAPSPLFDLKVAARRIFWVAACAGIVVFGTLMAAMFVGQQFLQNVLGYTTLESGSAMLPAAAAMVIVAPHSARLVTSRGSRFTLLLGYAFILVGLIVAFAFWKEDIGFWPVLAAFLLVGIGVGFAGTPASHSLTGSVPVSRAGMASGTADLQRDLGGAIMQSLVGAVLTAGYVTAFAAAITASPEADQISANVQTDLQKSFSSAADVAERYPQYADQIIAAAKSSFLAGESMAIAVCVLVVLAGAVLVYFCFPRRDREVELLASYAAIDGAPKAARARPVPADRGQSRSASG
jgi:DHA2 family multidrug resistance protein-like MFS transporter